MILDEKGKEELYQKYYSKVLRYVNSQINNYNQSEDFASEIFVKIFEKLDTFDETKSSISTWIYTLARNYLFDYYRTRKVEVEFDETWMKEEDDDEGVYSEENLEKLAEALKELKEKEKVIIVEHYYKGASLKDIAAKMGISYIYAKVIHAKALEKIKKYFNL